MQQKVLDEQDKFTVCNTNAKLQMGKVFQAALWESK